MSTRSNDFPDWLGPMIVKELRQGLKARTFTLSFVALQIVLVIVVAYHALLYQRAPKGFDSTGLNAIFWMLLSVQLLIVTPGRALNALAAERRASTLELIFMSGLSAWRIAVGKWASLLCQAALFVVAVLPYAILRYFFGSVNLAEDWLLLAIMLLLSAVLSAAALAVSGAPPFARMAVIIFGGFFAFSAFPALLFGIGFRGSTLFSPSVTFFSGPLGWVQLYDVIVLTLLFLEVAASSIAPLAENHTLRHRLIALSALLPLLIVFSSSASLVLLFTQLTIFLLIALTSCAYELSREPLFLRNQVRPFAARGRLVALIGRAFYPGWPSALLFLLFAQGAAIAIGVMASGIPRLLLSKGSGTDLLKGAGAVLMVGAATLTPRLVLFWRRGRWPLFEHGLAHLCGVALAVFVNAMLQFSAGDLGNQRWLALYPPAGIWALLNSRGDNLWVLLAGGVFVGLLTVLAVCARPHWRQLRQLERELRAASPLTQAMQAVQA